MAHPSPILCATLLLPPPHKAQTRIRKGTEKKNIYMTNVIKGIKQGCGGRETGWLKISQYGKE